MAKQLIPEELNALIQEYLTDGVLTDKERAVILKKAEGMGLDRDEIDLYLDAQVQKIDQATDAAVRKQKGKTCPYCGGSVPLLTDKCPHCGENITVEASAELQSILDNLEEALIDLKSGKDIKRSKAKVEGFVRKANLYYSNNPKIKLLLEQIKSETLKAEKLAKRNSYITGVMNFGKGIVKHWFISFFIVFPILFLLILGTLDACFGDHSPEGPSRSELLGQQIDSLIKMDKLSETTQVLQKYPIPEAYNAWKAYDPIYLKVINAYLEKGDLKSAGDIGLLLKSQMSSYYWNESSCYKILKFNYTKDNMDFSLLDGSDKQDRERTESNDSAEVPTVETVEELDSITDSMDI